MDEQSAMTGLSWFYPIVSDKCSCLSERKLRPLPSTAFRIDYSQINHIRRLTESQN